MRKFTASMSFDLNADVTPQARKLLLAEMAGRRWQDTWQKRRLPRNTLRIRRSLEHDLNTDDLHRLCAEELRAAARAVQNMGMNLTVSRAYVVVSGSGTSGLTEEGFFEAD